MCPSETDPRINRREFIKTIALATGTALTVPPFVAMADAPFRVGVVLPESRRCPAMGQHWLAGARLGLEHTARDFGGQPVTLIPKTCGATPGRAAEQVRAFGAQGISLVSGMAAPAVASHLKPYLRENGMRLLLSSLGANLSDPSGVNPRVHRHTLNNWQAEGAVGAWAAAHTGRRCIIVSSFYDSGFDFILAFRGGFEQNGGNISEHCVLDAPIRNDNGLTAALATIGQHRPDLVYVALSGPLAGNFFKAWHDTGLSRKVALITSGFTVDEPTLRRHGHAIAGAHSGCAWTPDLDTRENQFFTGDFKATFGEKADAFALLGFETARLIAAAVQTDADAMAQNTLQQLRFKGPRGEIRMDPVCGSTSGPVFLRRVTRTGDRFCHRVVASLERITESSSLTVSLKNSGRSRWLDMYLT